MAKPVTDAATESILLLEGVGAIVAALCPNEKSCKIFMFMGWKGGWQKGRFEGCTKAYMIIEEGRKGLYGDLKVNVHSTFVINYISVDYTVNSTIINNSPICISET